MTPQVLSILGSTGSIGVSTLSIISQHPDKFKIFALSGYSQLDKLLNQCLQFNPVYVVVADQTSAEKITQQLAKYQLKTEVLYGAKALVDICIATEVDAVMAAIVGAAGLPSTLAAAKAGKKIYLANKESLVMAGSLLTKTAKKNNATILPVDSEHNAIFQVLPSTYNECMNTSGIQSLILTASGGPFLNTKITELGSITPDQAIKHPNWSMGKKISVDSATMMNKCLELIEAHWLFNCPAKQLEVIIHPQSIVHSMVRYIDGSVLAQLGNPDMRIPIAYCLGLPSRITSGVDSLDFAKMSELRFFDPDYDRFPSLKLAYQVIERGDTAPCILNAVNEVAVEAFLKRRISFVDIVAICNNILDKMDIQKFSTIEDLMIHDQLSRTFTTQLIKDKYQ